MRKYTYDVQFLIFSYIVGFTYHFSSDEFMTLHSMIAEFGSIFKGWYCGWWCCLVGLFNLLLRLVIITHRRMSLLFWSLKMIIYNVSKLLFVAQYIFVYPIIQKQTKWSTRTWNAADCSGKIAHLQAPFLHKQAETSPLLVLVFLNLHLPAHHLSYG